MWAKGVIYINLHKAAKHMNKILEKLISINSLDELDAGELASLIHFLIDHELKPGGPYKFTNDIDQASINNHIYELFLQKGKLLDSSMSQNKRIIPTHDLDHMSLATKTIYEKITHDLLPFTENLRHNTVNEIIQKVKKADGTGEISDLTNVFLGSIKAKQPGVARLTDTEERNLGMANALTWVTYSLIDHILDEDYEKDIIPVISFLQRKISHHYSLSNVNQKLFDSLFSQVDQANIEELRYRLQLSVDKDKDSIIIINNNFENIESLMSTKSIAHTLGPQTIALKMNSSAGNDISEAMKLYCSARQLNDDLHDWIDDLESGQITYVISEIFKSINLKPGSYPYKTVLENMKQAYWDNILSILCKKITKDVGSAKKLLENNFLKNNSEFVTKFLSPISNSATDALNKHEFEKQFLLNYPKN